MGCCGCGDLAEGWVLVRVRVRVFAPPGSIAWKHAATSSDSLGLRGGIDGRGRNREKDACRYLRHQQASSTSSPVQSAAAPASGRQSPHTNSQRSVPGARTRHSMFFDVPGQAINPRHMHRNSKGVSAASPFQRSPRAPGQQVKLRSFRELSTLHWSPMPPCPFLAWPPASL